MINCWQSFAIR